MFGTVCTAQVKADWLARHVRKAEVRREARRPVGLPEEEATP